MKTVHAPILIAGLSGAVLLAACGGGGGDAKAAAGTLKVSLTDAPACGFDNVFVTVNWLPDAIVRYRPVRRQPHPQLLLGEVSASTRKKAHRCRPVSLLIQAEVSGATGARTSLSLPVWPGTLTCDETDAAMRSTGCPS